MSISCYPAFLPNPSPSPSPVQEVLDSIPGVDLPSVYAHIEAHCAATAETDAWRSRAHWVRPKPEAAAPEGSQPSSAATASAAAGLSPAAAAFARANAEPQCGRVGGPAWLTGLAGGDGAGAAGGEGSEAGNAESDWLAEADRDLQASRPVAG